MALLLIAVVGRKLNRAEAAQAGADGDIVKPFTQDVLLEKPNRILLEHSLASA